MRAMKVGNAGYALLAEARRWVWAVRPEFWDPFSRMLGLDQIPIEATEAHIKRAETAARRDNRRRESAVAVVPLHGVITPRASILSMLFGGGGLELFRRQIAEAASDDDVSAIVLDVDSPGGSSALVEETAADVRAAGESKPVVAVANADMGSAAYWIASQATELSATPSALVGSIGAFVLHYSFEGMNEKMGIEPTYIAAGRFKTEGNEDEALSDEARDHLQSIVDASYDAFVRDVALGRGASEKAVRTGFGEGRMLPAADALAEGMVDRVETLESAVARMLSGGEDASLRSASADPSDRPSNLSDDDEAEHEEPGGPSSSSKSRREDEAFADQAIASLTR